MVAFKAIQVGYPYFEAPGSAIPAALSFYRHWTLHQDRLGLFAVLVVSVVLLLARRRRGVTTLTAVLALAWLLSGEILMTAGIDNLADAFRTNLPGTLNWVDKATGGKPTTFLGQGISDPNGVSLAEFWNHSIDHVDSLDATAPGPGPTSTPNIVKPDGLLGGFPSDAYVARGQRCHPRRPRRGAARRPRPLQAAGARLAPPRHG